MAHDQRPWHARRRTSLAASITLLCLTHQACAALGSDESSIEADRMQMKAQLRAKTSHAAYTVHEIQTPGGTTVREFVSADGKVFAVSWRGPAKPDLRAVLGASFARFVGTPGSRAPGSHHHLRITRTDLVVQSDGHMRALFGRAYLPQLVPAGLSVETLE